ncbi:hypothetical protein HOA59_02535 [archaeon]|jgi:hypothetical protein|nr:hypothetical protein [archaeon]MBT6824289.1 hypothetical protein [archaeon]MBT7107367.1 hypothetical protein [archaeon]MBT7297333.1 hypothetical protein [archaeon]
MEGLKKLLVSGCLAGSLCLAGPTEANKYSAPDSVSVESSLVDSTCVDHPDFCSFFDYNRISYDVNYDPSLEQFEEAGMIMNSELVKKLNDDFELILESNPGKVSVGLRYKF